jgi:flavin-dependent dehydrogenase
VTPRVLVEGTGVAGLTVARLLARRGCAVTVVDAGPAGAPPAPALVLNPVTIALLEDLWDADGTLLAGAHPLSGRVVAWGRGGLETAAEPALSLDGGDLGRRLRDRLAGVRVVAEPPGDPDGWDWVVEAGGAGSPGEATVAGRRCVLAARVRLAPGASGTLCRMTTVPGGWIHLAPLGAGLASVQAMVPGRPEDPPGTLAGLVAADAVLGALIAATDAPVTVFEAAPRLARSHGGPGRLVAGTRAMRLDPLSGAGVTAALRQAVLAAAVVTAPAAVAPAEALAHYARRLHDAFLAHLTQCLRFYRAAFPGPAWRAELDATAAALDDVTGLRPPGAYRLRLQAVAD